MSFATLLSPKETKLRKNKPDEYSNFVGIVFPKLITLFNEEVEAEGTTTFKNPFETMSDDVKDVVVEKFARLGWIACFSNDGSLISIVPDPN